MPFETVLGKTWVWILLGEEPEAIAVVSGAVIIGVLVAHSLWMARSPDSTPCTSSLLAGGSLSATTVRHIHASLHRALRDAVRWGWTMRNSADQADPPKRSRSSTMRTWKAEEVKAFLSHVGDDRLHTAWLLLATTGMRRGEALGLRWDDLDLEDGWASTNQSLISVGYAIELSEPKTQRGRRRVALDATTAAALRDHRTRQLEECMAWGPAWENTGNVFVREDGSPIHPDAFSKQFNSRVATAGLPRIRLHDLRHTHATLALQAGIHPRVVSERLGHATIAITLDTYSHAIPAMEKAAADQVAALVFGA